MTRWLVIAATVLALDQGSKHAVQAYLASGEVVNVIPGFNLVLFFNTGMAFSLLSDAGGWQRWLFTAVAIIISVVLVGWLKVLEREDRITGWALALLLGGALGNLWDRLARADGAVVDFIDIYYDRWHWAAFNVADMAICGGAALLILTIVYPPVTGHVARDDSP